jgi:hypothetical protein
MKVVPQNERQGFSVFRILSNNFGAELTNKLNTSSEIHQPRDTDTQLVRPCGRSQPGASFSRESKPIMTRDLREPGLIMREVLQSRWRGALIDGMAVLAGILIAFAIDAWWETRSGRAREHAYLAALSSELAQATEALRQSKALLERERDRSLAAATILSSATANALPTDSVRALTGVGPWVLFTPPRTALDDVIRSGGLVLIRSDSVRRALAGYEQAITRDLSEQERLIEIWTVHLAPYRYRYGSMHPDYKIDRDAFVRNRYYANLVMARATRMRAVLSAHDTVNANIGRLRSLLENR